MIVHEDCLEGCTDRADLGHKPQCIHFEAEVGRVCPDSGACHHQCEVICFRALNCGPLSWADFPEDRWPDPVRREADVYQAGHDDGYLHAQMNYDTGD